MTGPPMADALPASLAKASETHIAARPNVRRARCASCGRPIPACWCGCIRRVAHQTPVLILQHPDEQHQAKGTGGLLARCASNADLRIGERFDAPASTEGWMLLYPESAEAAPHGATLMSGRRAEMLVILDGTWRKSRLMLHRNAWLRQLPRLALSHPPPSRYSIRSAQAADQRSTLEACALALAQLEGDSADVAPLWEAMDAFMSLHHRLAGAAR